MLSELNGPELNYLDFQNISIRFNDTLNKYSELSLGYKIATIALTILGSIPLIFTGIFVFDYVVHTFHEWKSTAPKKIAEEVKNVTPQINSNPTQAEPIEPQADPIPAKPTEPKIEGSPPAPLPPIQPKEEPPFPIHQQIYIKSLALDWSEWKATSYLQNNGKPGDYLIINGPVAHNRLCEIIFKDQNGAIQISKFCHEVGNGERFFYGLSQNSYAGGGEIKVLSYVKNPIHPNLTSDDKRKIQGAVKDLYYLSTIDVIIELLNVDLLSCRIGAPLDLNGLLEWLEKLPNQSIKEELSTKIFPYLAKAFGHVFSVDTNIKINEKDLKLAGLPNAAGKILVGTFQHQHLKATKLLSEEEREQFKDYVEQNCSYQSDVTVKNKTYAKQIYNDIKNGKIISLATGYRRHATNITISKEFICYTNRGDRLPGNDGQLRPAGSIIFKIVDFDKLTPDHIQRYFDNPAADNEMATLEILRSDIEAGIVDLKSRQFIQFKDQHVGNCTFFSNISNSRLTAYITQYRKALQAGKSPEIAHEESKVFATNFYKELRIHNKTSMMNYWRRLHLLLPEKQRQNHFEINQRFNRLVLNKKQERMVAERSMGTKTSQEHAVVAKKIREKAAERQENYKTMYLEAHENMACYDISLKDILPKENGIGPLFSDAFPRGTFRFYRPSAESCIYIDFCNLSSCKDYTLQHSEIDDKYILTFKGNKNYTLSTIGELVQVVKEISGIELIYFLG